MHGWCFEDKHLINQASYTKFSDAKTLDFIKIFLLWYEQHEVGSWPLYDIHNSTYIN